MYGIAPSDSVYIRLEVNPYEVDAFGAIDIRLSEIDADPNLSETLKYTFTTKNFISSTKEIVQRKTNISYPNPFSDMLTVSNPHDSSIDVQLRDLKGDLLKQLILAERETLSFEVSDIPDGLLNLIYCYGEHCYSELIIHIR